MSVHLSLRKTQNSDLEGQISHGPRGYNFVIPYPLLKRGSDVFETLVKVMADAFWVRKHLGYITGVASNYSAFAHREKRYLKGREMLRQQVNTELIALWPS